MSRARKQWLEWFRVDRDVFEHPKTLQLAAACGWSPELAVGHLMRMWSWVARYAPAGQLGAKEGSALELVMARTVLEDATSAALVRGGIPAENRGNPGSEPVVLNHDSVSYPRATHCGRDILTPFVAAGFLHRADDGGYEVHDWYAMNGTQLRERAYDRGRHSRTTSIPEQSRSIPGLFPSPTETETVRNGNTPPNPPPEEGVARFEFPLTDSSPYAITEAQVDKWRGLFPGIDVEQSLRNCLAWNLANPANRKTRRGIVGHVTRWLTSDQDRSRPQQRTRSDHRAGPDQRYKAANRRSG